MFNPLRKLFPRRSNIRRPIRLLFVYLVVVVAVATYFVLSTSTAIRRDIAAPIVLSQPTPLSFCFANDTATTTLPQGDTVSIIGVSRGYYSMKYWVETASGERGHVEAHDIALPIVIVSGGNAGDTALIVSPIRRDNSPFVSGYTARLADGTEIELKGEDIEPTIAEWYKLNLNGSSAASSATTAALARLCEGKTFAELEERYGEPQLLQRLPDGSLRAKFLIKTLEPSTGKSLWPTMTFAPDGTFRAIAYREGNSNNASILSLCPWAEAVINASLAGKMIASNTYEPTLPKIGDAPTAWKARVWGGLALSALLSLVWFFLTPSLLVLLIGWLLRFPRLFSFISNLPLAAIVALAAVAGFCGWAVVMLSWGLLWPLLIVAVFPTIYFTRIVISLLPERCPHCGALFTMAFDDSRTVKSSVEWGKDIVTGRLLGSQKKAWREIHTWGHNAYVDRHGVGHQAASHKETTTHTETTRTYEQLHYDVKYRLDTIETTYRCARCNHTETTTEVKTTELERRQTGTSTHTSTSRSADTQRNY